MQGMSQSSLQADPATWASGSGQGRIRGALWGDGRGQISAGWM
eukprot:CAMPEP_0181208814 /NCGR_PEP_ID=MMETSP1096-20121128/22326_1 /TAXON_ID=156174 ORGANISM="Chrysochromulina ericina, Strain CCMP281" /NCGR_SAMPLE_ID=MMETSP1096 /ASSEMBLY_ACC=CAM_ASM_000453 /LENGTH=42 /DNA_ID= /DNA_START= /DNA_END= /DNA_ORIENTATION=